MRPIYLIAMAILVIGAGIMAGCVEEVLDPDLDYEVLDVEKNSTSPNPSGVKAENGTHFLWVKIRLENHNENSDLSVGPTFFTVDNNADVEKEGEYLANATTMRRIDTLRVDPGSEKEFWIIFNVPDDTTMEYIRYVGSLDEPVEKELPDH